MKIMEFRAISLKNLRNTLKIDTPVKHLNNEVKITHLKYLKL